MRDEILNNKLQTIGYKEWKNIQKKAEIYIKCKQCRSLYPKGPLMYYYEEINEGDVITIHHIISLLLYLNMYFKSSFYCLILSFLSLNFLGAQNLLIDGSIIDDNDFEIPFAAVGILKKNIIGKIPMSVANKLLINKICKKGSLSDRTFIHKISTPIINAPARHK